VPSVSNHEGLTHKKEYDQNSSTVFQWWFANNTTGIQLIHFYIKTLILERWVVVKGKANSSPHHIQNLRRHTFGCFSLLHLSNRSPNLMFWDHLRLKVHCQTNATNKENDLIPTNALQGRATKNNLHSQTTNPSISKNDNHCTLNLYPSLNQPLSTKLMTDWSCTGLLRTFLHLYALIQETVGSSTAVTTKEQHTHTHKEQS